jgi:CheY-like chemotaxis protein
MESLGALAGGVAHDMNNVLGAVMGLASVHLTDAPEHSTLHKDLEAITNACQRGAVMVRGLLGFARESVPVQRDTDLNAVVREVATLLERTTLQKIRLDLHLCDNLHSVRGDPAALLHALMNLCMNALDAMPNGGTLLVRTANVDSMVLLEVADTGTGMPADVIQKALEPFFTTKPMGKGTGLGLPIVYGTVKAHQGRMEITSQPGYGTQARLYFPADISGTPAPPSVRDSATKTDVRQLNVLLVDDDELVQHAVHRILRAMGHTVTTVSGGAKAVAVVEAGLRPDLVVLDMNMPELDGTATLPRLRMLLPDVPVVLATGRADQAAADLVANYPFVSMLPKPFNAGQLGQKLESLARKVGL